MPRPEVGIAHFESSFKPLYDSIVRTGGSIEAAITRAIAYEDEHDLTVPRVYVSTAITSGGYRRDATLGLDDVIARNGRVAASIVAALALYGAPHVEPTAIMLPTELGHVPGWSDTQYLLFYFAWLAGLSASGAAWLEAQFADAVYAPIRAAADDRTKTNDERWPQYRLFTEVAVANLALAEARRGGKRAGGSDLMLQLIDVGQSLGCRAEEIFADIRGLDRLAPSLAGGLVDPLGAEVSVLHTLGASVGVDRQPVELVPISLR